LLTTSPALLEKISVNLPVIGWHAAFAMKYEEASHDSKLKEWKLFEIGADNVAMTTESRAARNTPIYMLPRVRKSFLLLISAGKITSSWSSSSSGGTAPFRSGVSSSVRRDRDRDVWRLVEDASAGAASVAVPAAIVAIEETKFAGELQNLRSCKSGNIGCRDINQEQ
jgi:hypothetical protein